ncbi:MAG: hypothetical protein VKP62_06100 [Candidatus Sericytochromatia bacterium]|nr:hypothetical protein [Candidatus Sericytochromatia bacterium]
MPPPDAPLDPPVAVATWVAIADGVALAVWVGKEVLATAVAVAVD